MKPKSAGIDEHTLAQCRGVSCRDSASRTNNPLMILDEIDKVGADFAAIRLQHC